MPPGAIQTLRWPGMDVIWHTPVGNAVWVVELCIVAVEGDLVGWEVDEGDVVAAAVGNDGVLAIRGDGYAVRGVEPFDSRAQPNLCQQ